VNRFYRNQQVCRLCTALPPLWINVAGTIGNGWAQSRSFAGAYSVLRLAVRPAGYAAFGGLGDEELAGNFLVRHAGGQQLHQLDLAGAERRLGVADPAHHFRGQRRPACLGCQYGLADLRFINAKSSRRKMINPARVVAAASATRREFNQGKQRRMNFESHSVTLKIWDRSTTNESLDAAVAEVALRANVSKDLVRVTRSGPKVFTIGVASDLS
jgi:hypothetical protein